MALFHFQMRRHMINVFIRLESVYDFFQQFLKGSECLWEKLCEQHNFKGSERNENETWRELHQVYNVNDTPF